MLEASIVRDGKTYKVSLFQLENAVFIFLYEDVLKMGTLAVSAPGLREGMVGTSSVLLGGKYLVASRALAERAAAVYNKMSIVSLNTSLNEGEALRTYSRLIDKVRQ